MEKMIYPGSFDPITFGHLDIIERAAKLCSILHVVVGNNPNKKYTFSVEERIEMLKESTAHIENLVISHVDGLIIDYCVDYDIAIMIRGLRALSDFDYEFQLSTTNRFLYDKIETVFLMSKPTHTFLSSSQAKEIGQFGGDLSQFVSDSIAQAIYKKFK